MDLSRSLEYPQSSTSELLRCLTRLGYLHYNRYRRTFSPTARVALLGSWVEPTLFRGGTVLTMDDASTVLTDADVLVVDDRIAGVGPRLEVPEGVPLQSPQAARR